MDTLAVADAYLFEGFRLDRRGLARRNDNGGFVPVPVGSRALEILGVLVQRSGELVFRDEIINAVWPGVVVEDSNLPAQIGALRRVLDNGRTDGSCIQTIPGRGYRFVPPVTRVDAPALPTARPSGNDTRGSGDDTPPIALPNEGKQRWRGVLATFAGALCLLAIAVAASNRLSPSWTQGHSVPRLSIVVLPFTNLGGDPDQQYLADGIAENLTTDLSRLPDMSVISRETAFTYRTGPVVTKRLAGQLGVRYVLEGSVQQSGGQIRVNAQLIDAETDTHLWAERFDQDVGDALALENEITNRIAIALNLELTSREAARPA
jgi:TolB-like protein/DNA-binding winged helix-turn-helix (wHTH) protein